MRRPRCHLRFSRCHLRLLQHTSLAQQVQDRDRRLRAFFKPFQHSLLLERDGSRRLQWVVRAKDFDVPPVPRHPGIRRHNSIEGPLPTAPSCESQSHHVCRLLFSRLVSMNSYENVRADRPSHGRPPCPDNIFIILRASKYCLISRFTSCTLVPLPLATRCLRLPLSSVGSRRSRGVIESMIATMRPTSWSLPGIDPAVNSFRRCPPGNMSRTCSKEPSLVTCLSWSRKSSSVRVSARSFRAISSAWSRSTTSCAFSISDRTSPIPRMRDAILSG